MNQEFLMSKHFSFIYDDDISFSKNIEKLTELLSYNKITLFTEQDFNPEDSSTFYHPNKFYIYSISILGNVQVVKQRLIETNNYLKEKIEQFIESESHSANKISELRTAIIIINKFISTTNIHDHTLIEHSFGVDLINYKYDKPIEIVFDQCELSPNAIMDWQDHLYVRHYYMRTLVDILTVEIEKLRLLPEINEELKVNKTKELKLLEVWVALKEAGFFSGLSTSQQTDKRKEFFKIFNLQDTDYNNRNKELKRNKKSRAEFLKELVKIMENYGY